MKKTAKRLLTLLLAAVLVLEGNTAVLADVYENVDIIRPADDGETVSVEEMDISDGVLSAGEDITVEEVVEEGGTKEDAGTVNAELVERPSGSFYQGYEPERVKGEPADLLSAPMAGREPFSDHMDYYDGRHDDYYGTDSLPKIEDQGSFGLCWVFSAFANAETYALRNGVAGLPVQTEVKDACDRVTSYTPIFNPWLFYYHYTHNVDDPLHLIGKDVAKRVGGKGLWGGFAAEAALFMSGWCQPVDEGIGEVRYPLDQDGDTMDYSTVSLPTDYAYENSRVVLDHALSINKNDINLIKQQIYETGAVSVSYKAGGDDNFGNLLRKAEDSPAYESLSPELKERYKFQLTKYNITVKYRKKDDGTIYGGDNPEPLSAYDSNHAVVLVGYDDGFPKELFNLGREGLMPAEDGAWLIRNSWGQKTDDNDDGYFWISYYDPTLCNFWSLNFAEYSPLALNYHYDGTGNDGAHVSVDSGSTIANVFYIQNTRQYLSAVTVPLNAANVDYELNLYKVGGRSAESLKNGVKPENCIYSENGTTGAAGILKFPIDGLSLPDGKGYLTSDCTVAVVLKLSKDDGGKIEVVADKTFNNTLDAYHEPKANASFYLENGEWKDLIHDTDVSANPEEGANWRIKLITMKDGYISSDVTWSSLLYNPDTQTGDSITANISYIYDSEHTEEERGYSYEVVDTSGTPLAQADYEKIVLLDAQADSMGITAAGAGHVVIRYYNRKQDGTYDDFYSACTEVVVGDEIPKITLNETAVNILTGDRHQIDYTVSPENYDADRFKVCFETEEEYYGITISPEGVITAESVVMKDDRPIPVKVRMTVRGVNDEGELLYKTGWLTVNVIQKTEVTGIDFAKGKMIIEKGDTYKPEAVISPEQYNEMLYWSSDDTETAEVSSDGIITAKNPGTCRVTLSTKRNPENPPEDYQSVEDVSSSIEIEVIEKSGGYGIAPLYPAMYLNDEIVLSIGGDDVPDSLQAEWKASDTDALSLSADPADSRKVTVRSAEKAGEFTVAAYRKENPEEKLCECSVRVFEKLSSAVPVISEMDMNGEYYLTDIFRTVPEKYDYMVYVTELDTACAEFFEFTSDNRIIPKKGGQHELRIVYKNYLADSGEQAEKFAGDKITATAMLNISEPVLITGIRFEKAGKSMKKGTKAAAGLIVSPEVHDEKIIYRTSNPSVATVDENGTVSAVGNGNCVITALTSQSNLTAFLDVTVYTEGSGSGSGGGGGGGGTSVIRKTSGVPAWVISDGAWTLLPNGGWIYTRANGMPSVNEWLCVYNPYADTGKGQRAYDWFRFGPDGLMVTGWFTDTDGNRYYLSPVSDGTRGRMLTGKHVIDGVEYNFNDVEGSGIMGALISDM